MKPVSFIDAFLNELLDRGNKEAQMIDVSGQVVSRALNKLAQWNINPMLLEPSRARITIE